MTKLFAALALIAALCVIGGPPHSAHAGVTVVGPGPLDHVWVKPSLTVRPYDTCFGGGCPDPHV